MVSLWERGNYLCDFLGREEFVMGRFDLEIVIVGYCLRIEVCSFKGKCGR